MTTVINGEVGDVPGHFVNCHFVKPLEVILKKG
jgi:hypothetical protein